MLMQRILLIHIDELCFYAAFKFFFFCLPAATGIVNWILKLISWNDAFEIYIGMLPGQIKQFPSQL